MTTLFELAAKLQSAGAPTELLLLVVKATLILIIARLVLLAVPRASAATRHLIAAIALIAIAAMPVLTFVAPEWTFVVERAVAASNAPAVANTEGRTIGVTDAEADSDRIVIPVTTRGVAERALSVTRSTWQGGIVLLIAAGALLMLGQMFAGMIGVGFVARRAEPLTDDGALLELDNARDQLALGRDVRLLVSNRISVPVVWGFFRPVLLLPADVVQWPAERLRVVLLHELAHLKRWDGISLLATRAAVSIFWFHPLAWSLERAGRSECERACDDLVLTAGTKPSDYADHLLAIARSMPTFDPFRSVTLAMSRKSQLEGRLLSILQPHVTRAAFRARGVAIAALVALALVIPISAIRLIAEPAKREAVKMKTETKTSTKGKTAEAEVTVTPDVEAIGDFVLDKIDDLGKLAGKDYEPRDGDDWYERAYEHYRADRFAEAAGAFQKAAEMGESPGKSLYNAACSYALLGDAARATATLDQAIRAGWKDLDKIADDSDFDPIRTDARFIRLMTQHGSDAATRRVEKTLERYQSLRRGEVPVERKKHQWKKEEAHWYETGTDLLRLRRFDESIDAFQNAIRAGQKTSSAMYNLACAYSLKGDVRSGLDWLEKAIDAGYGGDEKLANDPDLRNLRNDPAFASLRERAADLEMMGCCHGRSWKNGKEHNQARDWSEAQAHHRAMTGKYPNNGRAWFNLGFAALQNRDFAVGQDAFRRALQLNYRAGTSSYNIACGYALQGDRNAALQWLEKARAAGMELSNHIDDDEDLESLRDDPRFEALRKSVRAERRGKGHDE